MNVLKTAAKLIIMAEYFVRTAQWNSIEENNVDCEKIFLTRCDLLNILLTSKGKST